MRALSRRHGRPARSCLQIQVRASAAATTNGSGAKTPARSPGAGRRQVHRAAEHDQEEALPVTAIDDYTRLRVLRIYDQLNQKTAIQFADVALDKLSVHVDVIKKDTDPNFRRRSTGTWPTAAFAASTSSPPLSG